jgi:hypothetical protein
MFSFLSPLATYAPAVVGTALLIYIALIAAAALTAMYSREPTRRRAALAVLKALLPWKQIGPGTTAPDLSHD